MALFDSLRASVYSAPPNTEGVKFGAQRIRELKDALEWYLSLLFDTSGVKASCIATAALQNDAVTADKLADHATLDANRAVTTNHIWDLAVTAAKLANGSVTIATKLENTGSGYQEIRRNAAGSAWEVHTPVFRVEATTLDGSRMDARDGGTSFNLAHGLAVNGSGVSPKFIRIIARCIEDDNSNGIGYVAGDEVDGEMVITEVGLARVISVGAIDTTNVNLKTAGTTAYAINPKAGGAAVGMNNAKWAWKIHCIG
jgi:hypothetical protein